MRLSEALLQKKQLQTRIKRIQATLDAAMSLHNEPSNEEPHTLLQQIESTQAHLEQLVVQIYRINAQTILPSGGTLIEAIAHRETITKRLEHFKTLLGRVVVKSRLEPWPPDRSRNRGTLLNPQHLRNQISALTIELQELDRAIHITNISTDINH